MNKALQIAVILTAIDQMSSVVGNAVNNSLDKLDKLQQANKKIRDGFAMIGAGQEMFGVIQKNVDAYGDQEEAALKMQSAMTQAGGIYDKSMYTDLIAQTKTWSEKYANTAQSYMNMVTVMRNNKITEKDIAGGIGEAAAKLADLFDNMDPALIGQFAARMRNDMGIAPEQMNTMMDMLQRAKNLGVGLTGPETVNEMNEFFSKVGLGLANLHVQGIQAGKDMTALGTLFMRRGITGQSVGTNFRRIFDGLRDPEKMEKAQGIARSYGKTLQMFDKQGKFLGVENFVNQIGKLQGMSPAAIASILKPFGGRQGLSTDFLEFLANDGVNGFKEIRSQMEAMGSTDEKLSVIMSGLNYKKKVFDTSLVNTKAAIGASLAPLEKGFLDLLNTVVTGIREFAEQNPKLMLVANSILAIVAAALTLLGVIKVIQGIGMAFKALNIIMKGNIFILIATLAVIAITIIYENWGAISAWFKNLWEGIKVLFSNVWEWIKKMFLNYTPMGLIIKYWVPITNFFKNLWAQVKLVFSKTWEWLKGLFMKYTPQGLIMSHWDQITAYFTGLWDKVKNVFSSMWEWIKGLGTKFYDAGKNIITNIWNGIKAMVNKPVEAIRDMAKKMRDYLPFSPAKVGALRDIHKIKLVETIAANIKAGPMVSAMNTAVAGLYNAMNQPAPSGGGGGGQQVFHFAPVINLTGGATSQDANKLLDKMKPMLDSWWRDKVRNDHRKKL